MDERVLVVDDTAVIREFLEEVMADLGFGVDVALNGQEGLELALRNNYVMVFCDVHMPVMNGLQMVRILKQARPEMPVIMTDSFPDREMEEALAAGAAHCLAKPFDLNDLRATVSNILKSRTVIKT